MWTWATTFAPPATPGNSKTSAKEKTFLIWGSWVFASNPTSGFLRPFLLTKDGHRGGVVATYAFPTGGGGDEALLGRQHRRDGRNARAAGDVERRCRRKATDARRRGSDASRRRPAGHRNRGFLGPSGSERSRPPVVRNRSEEHTSELQSLMRISYAV